MRNLVGPSKCVVIVLALFISVFSLYTARWGVYSAYTQRGIHLAILLPLAFLLYPANKKSPKDKITLIDGILAILAFLPSIYIVLEKSYLVTRIELITPVRTIELVLGTIMIILVLEAVRRAVTPVMSLLGIAFLLYLPLGPYFPGILKHQGFSFSRLIETTYLLTGEGFYGVLTGISARFVIVFIIFGSFITEMGAGGFFVKFARAVAGAARGGPAKIAVISSALFGTLSGSAVANVYTTGSFTIPLMKKRGFTPQFAGAVEAAASTGGQIMPPIMGAAAFVMSENLGIPYIRIALNAFIVAILYYFSLMMMIDFRCLREGLQGESKEKLPELKKVLKESYLFIPVVVLFYLLIKGFSPTYSAFTSIISAIVVSYLRKETRMTPKKIINALVKGGMNATMVAMAIAGAGIIVVVSTHTGLALTFSNMVVTLSQGRLFVALILIALTCIILGMGIPTTPAYVIASALGAFTLVKLGVIPLAAHMFVFYFAVISNITPPVAVAAYAAASIAGSKPMNTGFEAFNIALAGYIVPFMFVFNPLLLLQGSPQRIIISSITAFVGIYILAAAVQGWYYRLLKVWERMIFFGCALGLVGPGLITNGIAIIVFLLINLVQLKLRNYWHSEN
jgi:TRAP transporter 4TM/12TM fusion protein